MKLDSRTIAELRLAGGKTDAIFFDDELRGFGLRLRQRGERLQRSWVAQYRTSDGRTRRLKLGAAEKLLPTEARAAARKVLANVVLGGDPQGEREAKRQAATRIFGAVVAEYLEARARELRPASLKVARIYLTGPYFKALHAMPVSEVSHADVAASLRSIERDHSPNTALAARRALSKFFSWAIQEGLMGKTPVNPVIGTRAPTKAPPRDRVLSNDELVAIWNATAGTDDHDRIVRLLMLTGARASEIGGLCWSELNLDAGTWTLPSARSKNKHAHSIVLPAPALDIIRSLPQQLNRDCLFGTRSDHGFAAWSHAKPLLDRKLGGKVEGWRLHDIRRSVATHMAELGTPPHIVESVLGHYRQGVATTYNKSRYDREATAALATWAAHLLALVEGRAQANVLMFKG
jgi:integrase